MIIISEDEYQDSYGDVCAQYKFFIIIIRCTLSWQCMARAMDGHPRGVERWSDRRKGRGAEPSELEAA